MLWSSIALPIILVAAGCSSSPSTEVSAVDPAGAAMQEPSDDDAAPVKTPRAASPAPTVASDRELTLEPLDAIVPALMPLDQFLGRTRTDNEGVLDPRADEYAGGWVRYGHGWALRYDNQCAVEIAIRLPDGIGCTGAMMGIGFAKRDSALRRRHACLWPENSIKHSLGPGLAGELTFETGLFRAWLVDEARVCSN